MKWKVAVAALAASWGLIAVIVREVELDAEVLVFYRLAFAALTARARRGGAAAAGAACAWSVTDFASS